MTKALHITTDKVVTEVEVSGLQEMQALVGGLIEPVELSDGSTMWVNEEGLIFDLPPNSIASDVCGLGGRADLMITLGIRGNVFIEGPPDDEGDSTDVTDQARRWVQRVAREA